MSKLTRTSDLLDALEGRVLTGPQKLSITDKFTGYTGGTNELIAAAFLDKLKEMIKRENRRQQSDKIISDNDALGTARTEVDDDFT